MQSITNKTEQGYGIVVRLYCRLNM